MKTYLKDTKEQVILIGADSKICAVLVNFDSDKKGVCFFSPKELIFMPENYGDSIILTGFFEKWTTYRNDLDYYNYFIINSGELTKSLTKMVFYHPEFVFGDSSSEAFCDFQKLIKSMPGIKSGNVSADDMKMLDDFSTKYSQED